MKLGEPETGPCFRNGQAATLDEVIEFYDGCGDPIGTLLGGPKKFANCICRLRKSIG